MLILVVVVMVDIASWDSSSLLIYVCMSSAVRQHTDVLKCPARVCCYSLLQAIQSIVWLESTKSVNPAVCFCAYARSVLAWLFRCLCCFWLCSCTRLVLLV